MVERIKETKASEPIDYKRLAALMQLQKVQALLIGNLGGKLRLTPRARFDRYSVRPVSTLPKPWSLGGGVNSSEHKEPDDGGSPFDGWPR